TRKFREMSWESLLAHPDLRIRRLPHGQDPRIRTFRLSDTWTGVMLAPESGETFLLVHLLPKESAESWAADQRHDVNSVMGTLERGDAAALAPGVPAEPPAPPRPAGAAPAATDPAPAGAAPAATDPAPAGAAAGTAPSGT